MCPVEVGVATPEQARRVLSRLLTAEFCNEWGMYLHPNRHDVMSINTGLLALAQARYGQIEAALDLVQRMAKTLGVHMPGAISEALPDQWCFIQAWSALGIVSPIVEVLLGIAPRAGDRTLRVIPYLPASWAQVELRQLRVGEHWFAIRAMRNATEYTLSVQGDAADYRLEVGFYLPADVKVQQVTLNQQPVVWHWETTNAGRCLVCEGTGSAELMVALSNRGD
jgi:hypothetical protein